MLTKNTALNYVTATFATDVVVTDCREVWPNVFIHTDYIGRVVSVVVSDADTRLAVGLWRNFAEEGLAFEPEPVPASEPEPASEGELTFDGIRPIPTTTDGLTLEDLAELAKEAWEQNITIEIIPGNVRLSKVHRQGGVMYRVVPIEQLRWSRTPRFLLQSEMKYLG